MKKLFTRVLALALILVACMSFCTPALAASKSSRVSDTVTYTVRTGKKDSKLKVSQTAGKVKAKVWTNWNKTKTVTASAKGCYTVTVTAVLESVSKTFDGNSVEFKLDKNTTYTVTITYNGFSSEVATKLGQISHDVEREWKTYPRVKLSVNNSAKVE